MLEVSFGLGEVRRMVVRETAGAVSPRGQLLVVEKLFSQHHEAILATMRASDRSARILSAGDTFKLVHGLVE
ncbi:MAG TPA: hypothetical protein VMB91_10560, partial [Solirubrobacteraceae bacterium]|nr:hypothetical protein [Solirubrobacteraceae bacterium]